MLYLVLCQNYLKKRINKLYNAVTAAKKYGYRDMQGPSDHTNSCQMEEGERKDLYCSLVIISFSLNVIKRNLPNYPKAGWSAAKHRQE